MDSTFSPLAFLDITSKLKTIKRTGWVNHKVHLPESISDHMYRMAILCFLVQDPSINKERAMKVALAHDMAESIAGDITPYDGITKEEKFKKELHGMQSIKSSLSPIAAGEEFLNLWLEYENQTTPEAKLLKDFDKFEMIVTAFEYERAQNINLDDFFRTTQNRFVHPEVREWDRQLRAARDKHRQEKAHQTPGSKAPSHSPHQQSHVSKVLVTDAIEGEEESSNVTIFTLLCKHFTGFKSVSFTRVGSDAENHPAHVEIHFDSDVHSAAAMHALQNHKLTPFHFVKLRYK